jgi:hypothetical protein
LPTSKLALWSASGFTKAAISKAAALKIDTVSQAGACEAPWAKIARSLINGSAKLVTPKFKPFVDVRDESGAAIRIEDTRATLLLFDARGNVAWSIHQIVQFILNSRESRSVFLDNAPLGEADFYVEFIPPAPCFVNIPIGARALVIRIGVGVSTFAEQLCLDTASAIRDGGAVSTMASADAKLGRFQIYVEERPDGSPLLSATTAKRRLRLAAANGCFAAGVMRFSFRLSGIQKRNRGSGTSVLQRRIGVGKQIYSPVSGRIPCLGESVGTWVASLLHASESVEAGRGHLGDG